MKKFNKKAILVSFLSAVILVSCSSNGSQSASEKNVNQKAETKVVDGALTPKKIADNGENLVDQEVIVSGKVSHVCHMSGKKLFIYGQDDTTYSMQVFTGGEIDTFPREMMYKNVTISGILKVKKISQETILNNEAETMKKIPTDTTEKENCQIMERCHHVMQQVKMMKDYMTAHNTDYYPVYYVEGKKILN